MEASISKKREVLKLCHKIIPLMNEREITIVGLALNETVARMIKEGRVIED